MGCLRSGRTAQNALRYTCLPISQRLRRLGIHVGCLDRDRAEILRLQRAAYVLVPVAYDLALLIVIAGRGQTDRAWRKAVEPCPHEPRHEEAGARIVEDVGLRARRVDEIDAHTPGYADEQLIGMYMGVSPALEWRLHVIDIEDARDLKGHFEVALERRERAARIHEGRKRDSSGRGQPRHVSERARCIPARSFRRG